MEHFGFIQKKEYELLKEIGQGTYSKVFKSKDLKKNKIVAIKIICCQHLTKTQIQNAIEEIKIISSLKHPNIVKYYDVFYRKKTNTIFLIMEYLNGGDLEKLIRNQRKQKDFFENDIIWKLFLNIIKGLHYLHNKGIIHRDLKPGNVFISKNLKKIKIGDFNTSKILGNDNFTDSVIGTPYYLAPEIWNNNKYDYRCDVFSFGCLLYECICLIPPFRAKSLKGLQTEICTSKLLSLPKKFTKDWELIISALLQKDINKRISLQNLINNKIIEDKLAFFNFSISSTKISKLKTNLLIENNSKINIKKELDTIKKSLKTKIKKKNLKINIPTTSSSKNVSGNFKSNIFTPSTMMSSKVILKDQINKKRKKKEFKIKLIKSTKFPKSVPCSPKHIIKCKKKFFEQ